MSTAGSAINVSTYAGKGLLVSSFGANAATTSTVAYVYGFDSSPATALVTHTQTTATAKFESTEIDFATLKGTHAALYLKATFENVEGDTSAALGSAVLIRNKARSDQTITGRAIDIAAYKGNATLYVQTGAPMLSATSYTNLVTFQHATASTGTWVTVTNLAGTVGSFTATAADTDQYAIDLARLNRYVRVTAVQKNDAGSVNAILVAPMKSE